MPNMILKGVAAGAMVDRDGHLCKFIHNPRHALPMFVSHYRGWGVGAVAIGKQANGDLRFAGMFAESALGRSAHAMVRRGFLSDVSVGGKGIATGSPVPATGSRKFHVPVTMQITELSLCPTGKAVNPMAQVEDVPRVEMNSILLALRSAYLSGEDIQPFIDAIPDKAEAAKLRRLIMSPPGGGDPRSDVGTAPFASYGSPVPPSALYSVRVDDSITLTAPVSLDGVREIVTKHCRAIVRRESLLADLMLGL